VHPRQRAWRAYGPTDAAPDRSADADALARPDALARDGRDPHSRHHADRDSDTGCGPDAHADPDPDSGPDAIGRAACIRRATGDLGRLRDRVEQAIALEARAGRHARASGDQHAARRHHAAQPEPGDADARRRLDPGGTDVRALLCTGADSDGPRGSEPCP
jgi:hypothetical protein